MYLEKPKRIVIWDEGGIISSQENWKNISLLLLELFKSNPLKIVPRQGEAMEADKINDS
jgi:hypothetical protein